MPSRLGQSLEKRMGLVHLAGAASNQEQTMPIGKSWGQYSPQRKSWNFVA
jgi:hypothetical protein